MQTPSRAHSIYAMSSASTWLHCTASARLAESVPPLPDEDYSLEGTAAHKLLELCLQWGWYAAADVFESSKEQIAEYERITPDYIDAVQQVLDYVQELVEQDPSSEVKSESRVYFEPHPDLCGGTCDIVVVQHALRRVYIIDAKFGAGKQVDVEENDQVMGYALCAIATYALPRDYSFMIVIAQPRMFHDKGFIRTWAVSVERLDLQTMLMESAIADGESDNPTFAPSPERCRWCAACAVCKVAEQEGLKPFGIASYKQADTVNLPDVERLDPARLAYMLGALDLLKAYHKNVYARAMSLARAGVYIPGYKLAQARAERNYEYPVELALPMLRDMTQGQIPDDELAPRQLLGITELEKLLKRWARERVTGRAAKNKASEEISMAFALLTTKQSSGKLSLVPETHKAQAAPATSGLSRIVAPASLAR